MLEKRRSRGRIGGGGGIGDFTTNWDAPSAQKAQLAFEVIWFSTVLYLITLIVKVMRNVPSRERQPYILLLISAIVLDIALIMDAIAIRLDDMTLEPTSIALDNTISPLWEQPQALITMAGLWVFRKRSKLITYGGGRRGTPYAGQMWKFVADWIVTCLSLFLAVLAAIVIAVGESLYYNDNITVPDYYRFFDAQRGLSYLGSAFYFILTIVFVVTGLTLNGAFRRQMGHPDVVTRQMLIWVMPWLIIRALYIFIDLIVGGVNGLATTDRLALDLATVIVSGACWSGVLFGFIKTAADRGPWDWSHMRTQQPQMAPYNVQAAPAQPIYYAPPVGPPPQAQ